MPKLPPKVNSRASTEHEGLIRSLCPGVQDTQPTRDTDRQFMTASATRTFTFVHYLDADIESDSVRAYDLVDTVNC